MKLTTDEQARLKILTGKKADDLTDEEKTELKGLEEKAEKDEKGDPDYKGDLSQEAFNAMYAENKASRKAKKDEKIRADALQLQIDTEDEKNRLENGEAKDLLKAEKLKTETLKTENEGYRKANAKKWEALKKTLPPKVADKFKDGDTPDIISANIAKYDEYVEIGFITQDGKIKGDNTPAGGFEKYTWKDLCETPGLADKIQRENPELYNKLRKNRK